MKFKIDKDIPIPAEAPLGGRGLYPWRTLEIGESFVATADEMNPKYVNRRIYLAKVRTGRRFAFRREAAGVRIWRIE